MKDRTNLLAVAYLAAIVASVLLVSTNPPKMLPVWPGVAAPAAVVCVGICLVLRDLIQERVGRRRAIHVVLYATVLGATLSAAFAPKFAVASGVAFLVSELLDLAVWSRVRRSGRKRAILASNAVSIPVDSLVFLLLAFGSLDFLAGQIIGKVEATLAVVVVLALLERRRRRA